MADEEEEIDLSGFPDMSEYFPKETYTTETVKTGENSYKDTVRNSSGNIDHIIKYSKNESGKLKSQFSYDAGGYLLCALQYKYDEEGRLTEKYEINKKMNEFNRTVYKYDKKGVLIKSKQFTKVTPEDRDSLIKDEKDSIVETDYDKDGKEKKVTGKIPLYDDDGNFTGYEDMEY
jgi:hypothetical protein